MRLVIAEKPSVARSIAEVLGVTEVKNGYLESPDYLISWCIGHLIELSSANDYKEEWQKWSYETLPIIPDEWKYQVKEQTRGQYKILEKLLHDKRVSEVICATDAGREGELIFRLVYEQADCSLPVKRLWISSMEEQAIKDEFAHLKDGREYDCLYQSALCRSKADWLIGINATRLFSVLYHHKLTVGRVQTPTLAMLVEREQRISEFTKEKYYMAHICCDGVDAVTGRMDDKELAEQTVKNCLDRQAFVLSVNKEEKKIQPPKLYDLTSLQRDANRLFGYTAKQTLDYAQSLYEKKLITYPRTDSRYLTEDMTESANGIMDDVMRCIPVLQGLLLEADIRKVIDNSKVTDHHAIIPTVKIGNTDFSTIPGGERMLLFLIAVRLICAVSLAHVYEIVQAQISCQDALFTAKGKQVLADGWKHYEKCFLKDCKSVEEEAEEISLLHLEEGMRLMVEKSHVSEHFTLPPKHHTEDSMLSAMEHAGDKSENEQAERRGIGTPATRAAIIEKLVENGFVERKGRNMVPTSDGVKLITVLPEIVKSPELTSKWEHDLDLVAKGEQKPEEFLTGIEQMVQELVHTCHEVDETKKKLFLPERMPIGKCPKCGGNVYESPSNYYCGERCKFVLFKNDGYFTALGKELDLPIVQALLKDGKATVTDLLSKRTGRRFTATLHLDLSSGDYPRFRMEFDNKKLKTKKEK